jgi:adenosylcobalamin-dependent ribonucleoside-triphosphate reductase
MLIDHILAACVVAGGKRRSSRMSVKNWADPDIFEFINCKREDGAHWTTNISVEIDNVFINAYRDPEAKSHAHARAVMRAVILGKRLNGEPGFWNRSLAMEGEREPEKMYCPNPCGEICLHMWENCNLGHVNLEYFAKRPRKEMMEAFRLMARWLVRATFGDIPQQRQREVVDRNRRIGVGFFGFHGFLALNGIKYSECHENAKVIKLLNDAHYTVIEEATKYAKQIGIPVPVKFTTLAPTGSTAGGLVGTTTSGQALIAAWYKRLVRFSDTDPELIVKKKEGYETFVDPDARNTEICVFWCEDPLVAKVRAAGFDPGEILESQYDIPFEASLNVQHMLQHHYADNAISFTINLRESQLPAEEEMERQIFYRLPFLKGTTVFVEKSRRNMPIQPLTKAEFDAYPGRKQVTIIEEECKGGCPIEPVRRIELSEEAAR